MPTIREVCEKHKWSADIHNKRCGDECVGVCSCWYRCAHCKGYYCAKCQALDGMPPLVPGSFVLMSSQRRVLHPRGGKQQPMVVWPALALAVAVALLVVLVRLLLQRQAAANRNAPDSKYHQRCAQ